MVRLLHSCTKMLKEQGMSGMFIDGVKYGEAGFESLGKLSFAQLRSMPIVLTMMQDSVVGRSIKMLGGQFECSPACPR
jgi:hypothetical protein